MTGVEQARGSTVGELPGRRRLLVAAVGVVFWTWLIARWAYHNSVLDDLLTGVGFPDVVRSERNVSDREPWIPAEPFEAVADAFAGMADALGPIGLPLEWVAWLFDLAAFGTTIAPLLAAGAFVTVYLTILSMFFGLLIAVPLSVARVYGGPVLNALSLAYTELIRGTPLLAQLFFLYFGLPIASTINRLGFVGEGPVPQVAVFVAVIGFTINSSAYQAEYIRSALQSVDPGQFTAARAVGLSKGQAIRHVVLPQGLRFAIPGWSNEFVYLIKYSSLAAFITVPELFRQARNVISETYIVTDTYVVVAAFYIALVLTTALALGRFEDAVSIPGLGTSADR